MLEYDPLALSIVVASTVLAILLIIWRALLPKLVERAPSSKLGRLTCEETPIDWAVHFAVGFMMLAIFTLYVVSAFETKSPVSGAFTGVAAALVAYTIARPPVRMEARNPELDGRLFAFSVAVHAVLGIALAMVLVAVSSD